MNVKRVTYISIIIGELILIFFLSYAIYRNWNKKKNLLGVNVVTPLKKEFLIFPQGTLYSSFYEPKPNTIETNTFPWASGASDLATYTVNADGLNERFNYPEKKLPGVYRIITLGDSFTFGHYVNTSDNWTELLEDQLNKKISCPKSQIYEVINLGVRGYDLDFAAERYKVRGQKYDPDLVIWFVNDHHFYLVRELVHKREEQIRDQLSDAEKKQHESEGDYFYPLHLALQEVFKKYSTKRLIEQENVGLYDFAEHFHGPVVIVANQISTNNTALLKIFQHSRVAKTYLFQNISYINNIPGAAFPDGHPSIMGHQIYANEIYAYLKNQRILCS